MPSRVGLLEKVKILPEPTGFPAEYRSDHYEEAYAVFLIALIIYTVSNILPAGSSTEYILFTMFLERLSPLILVVATVLATEQVSKVFTNILSALSKEEIALTVEKRYLQIVIKIVIKIVICLMDILCIGAIVWGIYSGIEMIKFIIKVPELALFLESNL